MTGAAIVLLVFLALYFILDRLYPKAVDACEQSFLAIILAMMVTVSFVQVVARYGFNTGWGGALEFTRVLFAWLILFGMSYAVKINAHLGVDAMIRLFSSRSFKYFAIFGGVACVLYAVVLIYSNWLQVFGFNARGGALDYWSKMYKIGIGLDDLAYPVWAQEAFGLQDRVHRWVAYLILPAGLGLFGMRCVQAVIAIAKGDRESMIAAHEAEDLVANNKNILKD